MKKITLVIATFAIAVGAYAQGNIKFANAAGTALRYSDTVPNAALAGQKLAPGSAFVVGLYIGNGFGVASGNLQLFRTTGIAAPATSVTHAFAGTYAGGNPLLVNPAYITGQDITFQIRAWSSGFASYEDALLGNPNSTYAGASGVGTYTLKTGTQTITDTMLVSGVAMGAVGTGPVAPFTVSLVPEPATASLLGLGLASLLIFRRRK